MKFNLHLLCLLFSLSVVSQNDSLVLHLSFDNGDLRDRSSYRQVVNPESISFDSDLKDNPNSAARFDGENSMIFVPNTSEFEPPLTFSVFLKKEGVIEDTPGLSDLEGIFFKKSDTGIGVPYALTISDMSAPHRLASRSDPNNEIQQLRIENAIEADEWNFVVAHFEEEKLRLFLNYEPVGELDLTGPIVNNTEDLIIGAIGNNFGGFYSERYFTGLMDEFKVFNKIIPIETFIQDTIRDSLILHLSFDNGDLRDQSSYRHIVNPEFISFDSDLKDNPNSAARFDGENSKIFVPNTSEFEPPLTFSVFLKKEGIIEDTPGLSDLEGIFFKKSDTGIGVPYALTVSNMSAPHQLVSRSDPNNEIQQLRVENAIEPNEWNFVVAHFEEEKLRLFLNKDFVGELDLTGPIVNNTEDLIIGAIGNNFGGFYSERYFTGLMDEFKVFNRIIPITDFDGISSSKKTTYNPIKIFPNPVSEFITLQNFEKGSVEVFDINGQKMNVTITNNAINVSSLVSGVYILKISSLISSEIQVTKFVKN